MIPYYAIPDLKLPLGQRIDVFSILSTIAVFLGAWLAERTARTYAPGDGKPLREVAPWAVGLGLLGGHLMHLYGYHPELLVGDPWVLLRVWEGLSSMGGVLGALVGLFIGFRRQGISMVPHLDALALGAAPAWAVARVGCFLVHDHPGVKTDFPLAVQFPSSWGGPRHDLGLYDVFVLSAISALLWTVARRWRPAQGRLMGLLAVTYCPTRFGLDFLRASDMAFVDRRIGGLTPAQYVVVGLFGVGVWLLVRASPPTPKLTPAKNGR